jgi:uncharacterized membrane protein YdbT with pleckstrin-like domain
MSTGDAKVIKPEVGSLVMFNIVLVSILASAVDLGLYFFSSDIMEIFAIFQNTFNISISLWEIVLPVDALIFLLLFMKIIRLYWFQRYHAYTIGEQFFEISKGVVNKETDKVPYHNISDVEAFFPFILRYFHLGNVRIETNDDHVYVLRLIANAADVANLISNKAQTEESETNDVDATLHRIESDLSR